MSLESNFLDWTEAGWQAVAAATVMLTIVGLLIAGLLHRVTVESWRLRSWLLAAVLLQGLVIWRAPLHLGLIESTSDPSAARSIAELEAGWDGLPADERGTGSASGWAATLNEPSTRPLDPTGVIEWSWSRIFGVIWLAVVSSLVLFAGCKYVRLIRYLPRLDPAPRRWQRQWERVQRAMLGPQKRVSEMRLSRSAGPLVVRGLRGYTLIVPEDYWRRLSDHQRTGILVHECAHLRRHDVWRQLIARLVATLHWFNPIAWWALREYEQSAELACDQSVARQGRVTAAGFASALVELLQWHRQQAPAGRMTAGPDICAGADIYAGPGVQTMATPPLSNRISKLLHSSTRGDSSMKRFLLATSALMFTALSCFQLHLTEAQDSAQIPATASLPILTESTEQRLLAVQQRLDTSDATSKRLAELIESAEGKLAIAGLLNQLSSSARGNLRADALARFRDTYFEVSPDGKLAVRPEQSDAVEQWKSRGDKLDDYLAKMGKTTDQLASQMDPSSDAGKLFQRLLQDPQAAAAILLVEMKQGGDVVDQFLAESLGKILVERADGSFQLVPSRRDEAEKMLGRMELATELDKKLQRQMPAWSKEFAEADENHRRLIRYLQKPEMATVMAVQISDDRDFGSASAAADELFNRLETVSEDTPTGLQIRRDEVWKQFDEIFQTVDRVVGLLPRIEQRLASRSATLTTDDPLAKRLKAQMNQRPLATLVAADLPYAAAEPGDQLRAMLETVMTETQEGKLQVREDRADEVAAKAKELLQACRAIRRHLISIDGMLERMSDPQLVDQLGESRGYVILSEVRRFAEEQTFDSVELFQQTMLTETEEGQWQVREERRDLVRRLVEQAQQVTNEASNDDF